MSPLNESSHVELAFNPLIGEELIVAMELRAWAGAGADFWTAVHTSAADLSNSAHFYLDFADGDTVFAAASGHDYRFGPAPDTPPPPTAVVSEPTFPCTARARVDCFERNAAQA